jgi:hypothetical protein
VAGEYIKATMSIGYTDGHPEKFRLSAPSMVDAEGNRSGSADVRVDVRGDSLVITPNQEWLAGHSYPITLDSTIEIIEQEKETVEFGDIDSQDFRPKMRLGRWGDETYVSLEYEVREDITSVLDGNRIKLHTTGNIDVEMYPKEPNEIVDTLGRRFQVNEDGGLELDLILKQEPTSNRFSYRLESKGLVFHHQAEISDEEAQKYLDRSERARAQGKPEKLTDEEWQSFLYRLPSTLLEAKRAIRPEHVVNSYAVYHEEESGDYTALGGKNYRTGKAFHIYRPKVYDANGDWVWGDLKIEEGEDRDHRILSITVDQDYLDQAVYPVTVDPTFGYTVKGGSADAWNSFDQMFGFDATPSGGGFATNITGYLTTHSGQGNAKCALYNSSKNLITNGQTVELTSFSTGWVTFNFPTSPVVSSGNTYTITAWFEQSTPEIWYDSGSANSYYEDDGTVTYGLPWPDPHTMDSNSSSQLYSFYVTYTEPPQIYYSVGTETAALYSGNALASSGTLTLENAAVDNIGVGDEIRYGSNRYYITGRNSSTEFTLQNSAANGGIPGDTGITFPISLVGVGTPVEVGSGNMASIPVPAGIQNNDILILVAHQRDNVNSSMPVDWTQKVQGNGNTTNRLEVWWKRTTGTESAPTVTRAAGNSGIAMMFAFRGVVTSGDPFNVVGAVQSNAGSPISTAAISPAAYATTILHAFGSQDDNTWGTYTGVPTTEAWQERNTAGTDNSLGLTYGVHPSGSTGTAGATELSVGPDAGVSVLMALTPQSTSIEIYRAFNSLSSAESSSVDSNHLNLAGPPYDLVSNNYQLNWPTYADDVMDDTVVIDGYATDADRYIRIYTPVVPTEVGASQRHSGMAGTGFQLAPTGGADAVHISDDYTRISGIVIDGSSISGVYQNIESDAANVTLDALVLHDSQDDGIYLGGSGTDKVSNIIVYDSAGEGITVCNATAYLYSSTFYNNGGNAGVYNACGTLTVKNAASLNNGSADFGGTLTQDYNVSSDSSASCGTCQSSKTDYVNYFVDIGSGTEDFHLQDDSFTLWGTYGADLSGDANLPVTYDIDRQFRSVPVDIGADEVAPAVDVYVDTAGTQTATMNVGSTNQYVGGKFVITDITGSHTITSITITESGTVDALGNLDNIKLFYELDTTSPYDGASVSFGGSESQFGATDTDGFSAADGVSTFTDSIGIATTSALVVYVVFDVTTGAANGETVEISIDDPSTDVVASSGTVGLSSPVAVAGTTTISAVGSLTLADHDSGQVGDRFSTSASVTEVLYQFNLTGAGTFDVTALRVNFDTSGGVANGDVTNGELWVDANSNGAVDGADTMIQGSINGSGGQLIFTTDFTPPGSGANYLVRATVGNLATDEFTTFWLAAVDIDESAAVSETGSISSVLHIQDAAASCEAAFTWLGTPVDITPGGTGWIDVDLSATLPSWATGVMLQVVGNASTDYDYGVRMKGSSDEWMVVTDDDKLKAGSQRFYMVGVDAGRVFEIFQDSATITTYLVGYTGPGVTFFQNAHNKSFDSPLGMYQPINISGDTGTDTAIGAIFNINNLASSADDRYGLRSVGSGLDIFNDTRGDSFHTHVVGVDGSETAEAKIYDAALDLYLTGYITSGAVFFTTPLDKTTTDDTQYVDVDISGDIGTDDASGVFLEFNNNNDNERMVNVRRNGESYHYFHDMRHHGAFSAIDDGDIFEQRIEFDDMELYLNGYTLASCSGGSGSTTNYRSIGTASDYTTGDVAATNGSPIVVGNGTDWVTANRGRGDYIQIDGNDYTILSVETETQLTLAEPFAETTDSGLSYTIARQYATIQEWEDCISYDTPTSCSYFQVASADLTSDDRREVGIAYADTDFTDPLLIEGATTDADHDITLTADGINRHYGKAGQGVVLDMGSQTTDGVRIQDDYVTVEWLEVKNGTGGAEGIQVQNVAVSNSIVVRSCLVHDVSDIGLSTADEDVVIDIYNNIVYNTTGPGIRIANSTPLTAASEVRIMNNTVYNAGDNGIRTTNAGSTEITLQNNLSHNNSGNAFRIGSTVIVNAASSNNMASDSTSGTAHSPAGGGQNDISDAEVKFVNIGSGTEDLHIQSGSFADGAGADLSAVFTSDIDSGLRTTPWDVGADDLLATTAVDLVSFTATGLDGQVLLEWNTGSEIENLGFRLYRSDAEDGTYEAITELIPGLGSSPQGASYSYVDSSLTNGETYYYKLEDIETSGAMEMHGPVSATPEEGASAGVEEELPGDEEGGEEGESEETTGSRITYGKPWENEIRLRQVNGRTVELELLTEGFYAYPEEDGSVRLVVPGLERFAAPGEPAVPVYRGLVQALVGLQVQVNRVRVDDVEIFTGLRPSAAEASDVVSFEDGTTRAEMRKVKQTFLVGQGLYPDEPARLVDVVFQEDVKKALVEMSPLRWDEGGARLLLAKRMRVRVNFAGREPSERVLAGGKGRQHLETHQKRDVLARFVTTEPGLYGVRFEDLFEKGTPPLDTRTLRLSRQGEAVAFRVMPGARKFGRKSVLYFISEGADANPYGDEAVYELDLSNAGVVMGRERAEPYGSPTSEYWRTVSREENRLYQAAYVEAEDVWQWDWIFGPMTKSFAFDVENLVASTEPSTLEVWLQGASDFPELDHHARVYVNGTLVAEEWWDGETGVHLTGEVGPGVLHEGENLLQVEEVGDTDALYSMIMLDRFEVKYPSETVAHDGKLEGSFAQSGGAWVSGLENAYMFDVTGDHPVWLDGVNYAEGVGFETVAGHRYLVVDNDAVRSPEIRRPLATSLRSEVNAAEYLVIGPREFLTAAEPLLRYRMNEGLRTMAVAVEDVYSEFGYGEETAESIHEFLSYAYHHWNEPTVRHVLLLGDGTYDPKDYLMTGVVNHVPVKMLETRYMWTASDPWLVAVNGEDILPDVAIGRLPAASVGEVQQLVEKILEYETWEGNPEAPIVLIADNPDTAGDFDWDADNLAETVLSDQSVEEIHLSELGTTATRNAILNAFDAGPSIVSYIGHGGIELWANENLFHRTSVSSLSPQPQQPFLFTMNCLNGYFHFPYRNSLSEELLKVGGKGIIAAFSPTGLSLDEPAHRFHKELLNEILHGEHERLGDAILAGQEDYADSGAFPELLSIYHLLGDPALNLK